MNNFTLIDIENKKVLFCNVNGIQFNVEINTILQSQLIEFFSLEDAQKIIDKSDICDSLLTKIDNSSLWVPKMRMKYLSFFAMSFAIACSFATAVIIEKSTFYTFNRSMSIIFYPITFIFTDLINELYGYQMTKRLIYNFTVIIVMLTPIIQYALYTSSRYSKESSLISITSGELHSNFRVIFSDAPKLMLLSTFFLLITDTFNAYLFTKMRALLRGKHLWLRSLLSNCLTSLIANSCWVITYEFYHWSIIETWPSLMEIAIFKICYFVISLPFIYSVVRYIRYPEKNIFAKKQFSKKF